jgi:hypothetical protein
MSPSAKVYMVSKSVLEMKFPEETVRELRNSFLTKEDSRYQHVKHIFQNISSDVDLMMNNYATGSPQQTINNSLIQQTMALQNIELLNQTPSPKKAKRGLEFSSSSNKNSTAGFNSPGHLRTESFQNFYQEHVLNKDHIIEKNTQGNFEQGGGVALNSSVGGTSIVKRSFSENSLVVNEPLPDIGSVKDDKVIREIFGLKETDYTTTKGNVYTSTNVDLFCRLGREHFKNTKEIRNSKKFQKSGIVLFSNLK